MPIAVEHRTLHILLHLSSWLVRLDLQCRRQLSICPCCLHPRSVVAHQWAQQGMIPSASEELASIARLKSKGCGTGGKGQRGGGLLAVYGGVSRLGRV